MADKDLWMMFEKTGSIEDYLSYKGIYPEQKENKVGENIIESVDKSDRNDTIRSSYR